MPFTYPDQETTFQLAANLQSLREAVGLSRGGLAKASGMDTADIYRLETANTVFRAGDLHRLSTAMAVSPSLLFKDIARPAAPIVKTVDGPDSIELVRLFKRIGKRRIRRRLTHIAKVTAAHR